MMTSTDRLHFQRSHSHQGHAAAVTAVLALAGNRFMSAGRDGSLKLWDMDAQQAHLTMQAHEGAVLSLAAFPQGNFIVSGGADGVLHVWNVETGEQVRTLTGHTGMVTTLAIPPDGRRIVSGSADTTLRVWDALTGALLHRCEGHSTGIQALAISPDGRWLVSGEAGRAAETTVLTSWELATGQPTGKFVAQGGMNYLAFIESGRQVVTGSDQGSLKIRDSSTGEILSVVETQAGMMVAALMPDERLVVSSTQRPDLAFWTLETGERLHTLDAPSAPVLCLTVTPNGRCIIAGCEDGTLNMYIRQGI